jgi:putative membrane protein
MNAMLKKMIAGVAAAIGWLTLVLPGVAEQNADAKFLMDAIRTDLAEVRLGELASQRGQAEGVRHYGHMLVTDHAQSKDDTADLAKSLKVAVPTETSVDAQNEYESLLRLSGEAFDTAFINAMIKGHKEAIGKFKKEAEDGDDADVSSHARETLPKLEEHLAMAQSLQTGHPLSGS